VAAAESPPNTNEAGSGMLELKCPVPDSLTPCDQKEQPHVSSGSNTA
jgi:hypothetical protein